MLRNLIKTLCGKLLDKPEEQKVKPQMVKDNAVYVLQGVAKDQETIIRLRPWIEDEVQKSREGLDSKTKLYWNLDQQTGLFDYEVRFYNTSEHTHNNAS